jgi:superfamily I DNA/RNA helicase
VANVMRERAAAMSDAIVWAGTFHAVGARLLREGRAQEEAPRDPTACLRCHAVLLL